MLMILPICGYSQNMLQITSEQLKVTNLIFAEHEKFSKTIPLMELKINNLEFINSDLLKKDSINKQQIDIANQVIEEQQKQIHNSDFKIKTRNNIIIWESIGIAILITILCIL